mmetsp:Transcript_1505/g.4777  ORF Transcript_1505/g.4777 Transcript_1505/m.4777 type:complete len:334 (-) Transcript_1505:327-1328(-)
MCGLSARPAHWLRNRGALYVGVEEGRAEHVRQEDALLVGCDPALVDLCAGGRRVARDRLDERAAVGEPKDALDDSLTVRLCADHLGAAVVVQRRREHLGRARGAPIHPHLQRLRRDGARLARVERLPRAARVGDKEHEGLLAEEACDPDGAVEHPSRVAAHVEHQARRAARVELLERLEDARLALRVELGQLEVPNLSAVVALDEAVAHRVLGRGELALQRESARLRARRGAAHHQRGDRPVALDRLERVEGAHALGALAVDLKHLVPVGNTSSLGGRAAVWHRADEHRPRVGDHQVDPDASHVVLAELGGLRRLQHTREAIASVAPPPGRRR